MAQAANGLWMSQIARNLTDADGGILTGKRYLIHDRDPLFTAEFLRIIAAAEVESHLGAVVRRRAEHRRRDEDALGAALDHR